MFKRSFYTFAAVAVCALAQADPPQYNIVILHPSGLPRSAGYGIGNGQQVGQALWTGVDPSSQQATLWTGTAASAVNLNPPSHPASSAVDTDGSIQVGATIDPLGNSSVLFKAALWQGTAASYVDMSPPNANYSFIAAVDNGIEVGTADLPQETAGYWTGTPGSWTSLQPAGYQSSQGIDIHGDLVVGEARSTADHAFVWNLTTHVNTDLAPIGYQESLIFATDGIQHVGIAGNPSGFNIVYHAGLWDAATGVFTDLHPAGWDQSNGNGVHGGLQVGFVQAGSTQHAALWSGSAASFVDLQQFLPSNYISSYASDIDDQGNIIGSAYDGITTNAVMWVPVAQTQPPTYTFLGFFSPLNDPADPESSYKAGRTIPIKFSLEDSTGQPVTSAVTTISLDLINGDSATPIDISLFGGPSNDGANFRFDPEGGQYIFNLETRSLQAGEYRVTATIADTGQTHSDTFTLTAGPPKGNGNGPAGKK